MAGGATGVLQLDEVPRREEFEKKERRQNTCKLTPIYIMDSESNELNFVEIGSESLRRNSRLGGVKENKKGEVK